jgi:two-component system, cell cycle sensor histidine kinase and response regulator CckA
MKPRTQGAESIFKDLITSGRSELTDPETTRKVMMTNIVGLFAVIVLIPLGFSAYGEGNPLLGLLDLCFAGILTIILIYIRYGQRVHAAVCLAIGCAGFLFTYLFAGGGIENTGHLWMYTFPLFATFLLGAKSGAIVAGLLLTASLGVLALHPPFPTTVSAYSSDFLFRFIPSFLLVSAYSYAFEALRERTQTKLSLKNLDLERAIAHLENQEALLQNAQGELEMRVEERTYELRRINETLHKEIVARREAEGELIRSRELFATVLDSVDADVFVADLTSHEIMFANKHLRDAFGADVVGRPCWKVIRSKEGPCEDCSNGKLVNAEGVPIGGFTWSGWNEIAQKWYLHNSRAIPWMDGRYVHLQVAIDITQSKQTEVENARLRESLHQAQKMEALGTLAGGVAHDLNNILSGIVTYPDLLLMSLPEESSLRESLLIIKKSGDKCAGIVQDLLTLTRRGTAPLEKVNLHDIITEYLTSPEWEKLQSTYPKVCVEQYFDFDVLPLQGSPVHLAKTVMNLVGNAVEAMPQGGTVRIGTRNQYVDRPISGYDSVKEGDYVVLSVADNGSGISGEDLPRIFEPFYTKKKMGRSGTGLGLAVVWGTVKDHNGYIDVRSTVGAGAEFVLYFPAARELVGSENKYYALPTYLGKGEKILLVDDIPEQRQIASELLTRLGYAVVAVASGEKAVEYLSRQSVDLVVLDMIMDPGMDGLDTYKQILTRHPGQKAIVTSGFSESKRVKEAQRLGAGAYVKKPYIIQKLGVAIRAELDRGEER